MLKLLKTVEDFLNEYKINNKKVVVAFSAGPDSCALALSLNQLKEKFGIELVLAYFNHGWRKEALEEEEFTIDFAKKINAKYYIKKAPKNSKQTEETARDLRYQFFKDCAIEFKTDVVFLAHNKNDNVETLIYRLIKGTSIKGLTSIPKARDIYYRPLLEISKEEILDFLEKNNQNYKIDSSNENSKYQRNYIRNEVLPTFSKINQNYLNNIEILIKNAISNQKIVNDTISKLENKIISNNEIIFDEFIKLDEPYRLEILNNFVGNKLKYRDSKTLKKLDKLIIEGNKRFSIDFDTCLAIKKNRIFFEKKDIIKIEDNKTDKNIVEIRWKKIDE